MAGELTFLLFASRPTSPHPTETKTYLPWTWRAVLAGWVRLSFAAKDIRQVGTHVHSVSLHMKPWLLPWAEDAMVASGRVDVLMGSDVTHPDLGVSGTYFHLESR